MAASSPGTPGRRQVRPCPSCRFGWRGCRRGSPGTA
nr:MAG TPA: hypothetical protein [Caudoviricetes sp.]DAL47020.1 MAG TPA_asm: hypothetical protein [Caudoviricetes sp.]